MKIFKYIRRVFGFQSEIRQRFYPDGQLISQRSYKSNKLNGPFMEYYPNGHLQREGSYKSNRPDGEWKYMLKILKENVCPTPSH